MGEYINYWLKKLMKKTPKSSKLIDKVRKMSLEIDEDKNFKHKRNINTLLKNECI